MTELLNKTYHSIQKQKRIFAMVLTLVFLGLIWVASRIQFDEDISKLIPANDDNAQLQKVLNTAQFSDKIIVNISKTSKEVSSEKLTEFAQQFLDSLDAHSKRHIHNIQGKVEDETIFEALDFAFDNAPLFLTEADYKTLSAKLQKDSIEKLMAINYKILASPSGIVAKKTIVKDPLGISLMALQHLRQLGFNDDFKLQDGFLVSTDEQHILLFITPSFKSSETSQNERFAEQLYKFQNGLNEEFKGAVKSELFGGTLIAVANARQIKQDIQLTVSIALIALLLLFVFFYRKWSIPLILMVPTLFGGLLAAVVLSVIRQDISAISLGIGAVLLGVTLDYSLHILTHLRNNHTILELYADLTKPILMSSLTTALAFLCLLFIDSQALQDLGLFAAVSVFGASVFALVFIPQVFKVETVKTERKTTIIDAISHYQFHRNKLLVVLILLLLIVSAFTYHHVSFNNDISKLNYEPQALKDAEKNLDYLTNEASKSLYIIAYGNTMETALVENDAIFKVLNKLETDRKIISFNSVGALVFSKKSQQQKITNWNTFWYPEKVNQTETRLMDSGQKFGFKTTTFQAFYTLLKTDFKPLSVDDFQKISTLPTEDFISSKDNFFTITSIVKVENEQISFLKKQFKNSNQTLVIDRQNINESLLGNLKTDFNHLIGYCFGVVLLLLFLFYRSWKLTLVTVLPIVLTWFITIGIMGLFRMEFNIFSILISSFIFGLGVDYSIFMTNGLLKQKEGNLQALATYKTSVLLSVITTILGIGVLIFAKHPALYSLSLVSMIGIITAMLIAFTIQPLLFKLLIFDTQRKQ
ncbi:MAG: MMPL family transporter [Aquaticitalea sp.]